MPVVNIKRLISNCTVAIPSASFINIASHGTIRFVTSSLLYVVHCEHASVLHRYGDIAPQKLDACADERTLIVSNAMHCIRRTIIVAYIQIGDLTTVGKNVKTKLRSPIWGSLRLCATDKRHVAVSVCSLSVTWSLNKRMFGLGIQASPNTQSCFFVAGHRMIEHAKTRRLLASPLQAMPQYQCIW